VKAARSACKNPLGILEFAARIKLRRDRVLESSKEGRGSKSPHRNQAQEEERQVIWPGVFENLNGQLSFSEGETPIFHGPLDPVDQWEVKAECLSTLTSSGGLAAIRSESTRVIDLGALNFDISEVGSVEEAVFRNP
jgi:hypothetical protein